jgi:hypothetical protein
MVVLPTELIHMVISFSLGNYICDYVLKWNAIMTFLHVSSGIREYTIKLVHRLLGEAFICRESLR